MPVKHVDGGNVLGAKPAGTITLVSQRPYLTIRISGSIVLLGEGGRTVQSFLSEKSTSLCPPAVMRLIPFCLLQ